MDMIVFLAVAGALLFCGYAMIRANREENKHGTKQ